MDVQDATNLVMPEGEVKAIHDSANRLLWGRVNYDTKYAGDTTQNGEPTPDIPVAISVVTGEQTVTIMDDNNLWPATPYKKTYYITASGTEAPLSNFSIFGNIPSLPQKKYVISAYNPENWEATLRIHAYDSNGNWIEQIKGFQILSHETGTIAFTTPTNTALLRWSFPTNTSNTTLYQSQSYPISLGSFELCKIGTYQDKIYKSGDDWYVYKEIGKVELPFSGMNNNETFPGWKGVSNLPTDLGTGRNGPLANMTTYISNITGLVPKWGTANISIMANTNVDNGVLFLVDTGKTQTEWKTEYSDLVLNLYYAIITTPANTKITDATLINQLNAVHEWLTRYGYNSTVTGNLPMIINRTNL